MLNNDYDLAIEGFPRSGNTYLVEMLRSTQHDRLRIRSHGHVPAFVLSSVRNGKPVGLLIRRPMDAVISWRIFSGLPIVYLLRQYILYYSTVMPHKAKLCVIEFERLQQSAVQIIEELEWQSKLGLTWEFTEEKCRQHCRELITQMHALSSGDLDYRKVNWPNSQRSELKTEIRELEWESIPLKLRQAAEEVYSDITQR